MNNCVKMIMWDVQHGHSTYIKSPNSKHILIDLGTGSYDDSNWEFSPLLHLKNKWRVAKIDYLIISHPHLDHIDDILNLKQLAIKYFLRPKQISNEVLRNKNSNAGYFDKKKFEEYCKYNDKFPHISLLERRLKLEDAKYWGGMTIRSFIPVGCSLNNLNNHSVINIVEYAGYKVVIPGDNEGRSIDELLNNSSFVKCVKNAHVLMAPHHGRYSGYHSEFVKLVNPKLTIVSDGRYCDTSANGRYSAKSTGLDVYKKSRNQFINRKCLTTNSDGEVFLEFGFDSKMIKYLKVSIK